MSEKKWICPRCGDIETVIRTSHMYFIKDIPVTETGKTEMEIDADIKANRFDYSNFSESSYEFLCGKCHKAIDVKKNFAADNERCPECGLGAIGKIYIGKNINLTLDVDGKVIDMEFNKDDLELSGYVCTNCSHKSSPDDHQVKKASS